MNTNFQGLSDSIILVDERNISAVQISSLLRKK